MRTDDHKGRSLEFIIIIADVSAKMPVLLKEKCKRIIQVQILIGSNRNTKIFLVGMGRRVFL